MYLCPICNTPQLVIEQSLELPPDCTWDEITLQVVACQTCHFRTLAVYQESRRGRLHEEHVSHHGYFVAPKTVQDVSAMMNYCPRPDDARCRCTVHDTLGRHDANDCWPELAGYPHEGSFDLQRSTITDQS